MVLIHLGAKMEHTPIWSYPSGSYHLPNPNQWHFQVSWKLVFTSLDR
jgi:hypothetical protein